MAKDKRIRKKNFSADELICLREYEAQRNVTIKIYKQPQTK